jgi:hypothetical protein
MKKIVTIVGVMLMAGAASAGSYNWGVGPAEDADTGGYITGGTISLVWATGSSSCDMFNGVAGNTLTYDDTWSGVVTVRWDVPAGVMPTGAPGTAYYLQSTFTLPTLIGDGGEGDQRSLNPLVSGAFTAMQGGGFNWSASNAGWTAVPEPTSFALLALGAAAIGLRRRIRK